MQVRAALLAVTCGLVLGLSPGAAAGPPAVTVSRVPYGDGLTLERHRSAALADDAPVVVLVHDLLVGLGGYYGWDGSDVPPEVVTDGTVAWFGAPPEDDPDAWHEGNPRWWVRRTRDIPPVRLIARPGDAHAVGFQSALLARGADVTVTTIDGVSHVGLIQPRDVAGAEALAAVSDALGLPAPGRRH